MQHIDSHDHHDHAHDHDHDHAHHDHHHGPASRSEQAKDALKIIVTLGLGAYFASSILTGSLTNYINERFAWLAYVATVVLLLLGLAQLWDWWRSRQSARRAPRAALSGQQPSPAFLTIDAPLGVHTPQLAASSQHPAPHDHHEHHDHSVSWPVLAVVALPLLLALVVPSRPLTSAAISGDISLKAVGVGTMETFTGDPLKWNVLDWLRAFNRSDDLSSFNGSRANVLGFVYSEPDFPEDVFMTARFTVSCCVADASAIGLAVRWAGAGELPADTWVQVSGTFEVGEFRGDTVPILVADAVTVTEQPEHPYLYP